MKKLLFLALGLLIITPEANAIIFQVAPTDQSMNYLGVIFGGKVGTIQLGGGYNQTLSDMFAKFNYIVLTVGISVVSYIGVVSTINTAREGEAMGKKWNTMWIPMRAVLGMLLMIPSPGSGYSMIQTVVMWIILQGVGAANVIWGVITDNLLAGKGGAAATMTRPTMTSSDLHDIMRPLLKLAVCKNMMNTRNDDLLANSNDIVKVNGPVDFYPKTLQEAATRATNPYFDPTQKDGTSTATGEIVVGVPVGGGYETVCGNITFTAKEEIGTARSRLTAASPLGVKEQETNKLAEEAFIAKLSAIRVAFNALDHLASQMVETANQIHDAELNSIRPELIPPAEYNIPDVYNSIIYDMYTGELSVLAAPVALQDASLRAKIQEAKMLGWIHAGSYYTVMSAKPTVQYNPDVTALPSMPQQPLTKARDLMTNKAHYDNILRAIDEYFENNRGTNSPIGGVDDITLAAGEEGGTKVKLSSAYGKGMDKMSGILGLFISALDVRDKDPLLVISKLGQDIMWAAEGAWIAIIVGSAITAGIAYTCSSMNPAGFAVSSALGPFLMFFMSALAMLWGTGATLGVYIPMIPFLIFTVAAIGWMVAVIEAVVAAPILALGFVSPSADELGKTSHGISILANIFLRPMLMLFGWVLGVALLTAVIKYINITFYKAIGENTVAQTMFSWIIPIVMYVTLIMSVVNKCFALIHILPDKIMRWIGGQVEQTDMGAVEETKRGTESGIKATQDVQQGARTSAASGASSNMAKLGKRSPGGHEGGKGKGT